MIALAPLRIDENGLNILSIVLKADSLNLLDFDNLLKLLKVLVLLIQIPIVESLLISLLILSYDSLYALLLLVLLVTNPLVKRLLLNFVEVLDLLLSLLFLLMLLLSPGHNDGEDRLACICQIPHSGNSLLE